jgi:ubiquitin-conjugating enzyme E2 Q
VAAAAQEEGDASEGSEVAAVPVDGRAYTPAALKTIASELKYMAKSDDATRGWTGGPIGDNIGQWQVEVTSVPTDLPLWADMQRLGHRSITMHVIFPPDYPFSAPFMRVVRPRFAFRTGHVTIGGSICIELLTNGGWNPLYRMEGVMMHVCSTIYGEPGDPPARLDPSNQREYGAGVRGSSFCAGLCALSSMRAKYRASSWLLVCDRGCACVFQEAMDAFRRLLSTHGWSHWIKRIE